ncbi:MAG: hypothetical protein QMD86_01930 [Patescibacteria group bacterium]|nr:hypothetical protein [Patescibacteria group bacterium]
MKFFIASRWKNKEEVERLSEELKGRGHQVYSFLESGANLLTGMPIEAEMKVFSEALANWRNDPRISQIFDFEIKGLKECDALILLLPAGDSSHVEAGAAYGMGKKIIAIGPVAKPEVIYLMFNHLYLDVSSFLADLHNIVG